MVRAADVHAVLGAERDPARAAAARRAGAQHERVAGQPAERVALGARQRRGDEAVGRALEQRHLRAGGGAQRVGVAALPVAVDQRALAQVADAGAAAAQEAAERARLGHRVQRVRGVVDALRERRAQVRRAERDDVAHQPDPPLPALAGLAGGAARDQPAHRVPDQRDLLHLDRPGRDDLLEQVGERAAVVGDVAAGVVADVERAAAEIARQPRAVAGPAAEPPGVLGLHQAVHEHDEPRRRRRERGGERLRPRRDDAAAQAQRHRLLQVRALALQRVADQAVDYRERQRAARRRRERAAVAGIAPPQRPVGDMAGGACRAAQRRVDAARDRVMRHPGGGRARAQRAEDAARDRLVHGADTAGAAA